MPNPLKNKEWEIAFNELCSASDHNCEVCQGIYKDFISTLLSIQKQEYKGQLKRIWFQKGYQEGRESQKQEIIGIIEELRDYADHDKDCILSGIEAGRPTSDGGYEMKIGGKWYQKKPVDKTPKCDCGFSDLIEKIKGLEVGR